MDGTKDEKRGVTKTKKIRRSVELSGRHHPGRREWTGPAGRFPFPVTPNWSGPDRFLSPLQLKVKQFRRRLEPARQKKKGEVNNYKSKQERKRGATN